MPTRLIIREEEGWFQVLLHREEDVAPKAAGPPQPFEPPLKTGELGDLRWYLEDYLSAPFAVYQDRGAAIEEMLPAWGERLFTVLFGPGRSGRDAYLKALAAGDYELWIASAAPSFLGLPWELMKDPQRATPLALELSGVQRTLPADSDPAEPPAGEVLRVLMVITRPSGLRDVRYRMIARPLLRALGPVAGEVRLEVLRPPTFSALKSRLAAARRAEEPFHVLHFDGHGSFGLEPGCGAGAIPQTRTHRGYLLFETATGWGDPIAAEDLAPVLADAGVPLLVLNACQSGMLQGGETPGAAVATRLLIEGTAAVVAMGYSVYAVAAAEFMAAFYEALFAGEAVTRAVAIGRREMREVDRRPSPRGPLPLADWLVPVCYARHPVAFTRLRRRERPEGLTLEAERGGVRRERREAQVQAAPTGATHAEGELAPAAGLFLGRDNGLLELERGLRQKRVVLIHGPGGTGKTELAKGLARWLQESGGLDRPAFFHSFEPGIASFGLDGVVASVGLRLFGKDFARRHLKDRRDTVLQELRESRLLLLWDNFETVHSIPDPAEVTPPLDEPGREVVLDFLAEVAREAKVGVVITSRNQEEWLGSSERLHRLELGGLDPEEVNEYAEALLAPLPKARKRRQEPAYAELLEYLGGHPLGLRLTLPHLVQNSAADLLAGLRGEEDLPTGFGQATGRVTSLDASVHYSFRHLPAEDQRLLPSLALFEGVADIGVVKALSRVAAVPARFRGVPNEIWVETLRRCADYGLLTPMGLGMYRIQPALPAYLLDLWQQQAGEDFEAEHAAALRASIEAFAGLSRWLSQQIEGGSAETAFTIVEAQRRSLGAAATEALGAGLYEEAQAILQLLDELWDSRGLGNEARVWVDRCRAVLEDEEGQPRDLETPAGSLWHRMVLSQADRAFQAGALDEAESTYEAIRLALTGRSANKARRFLAFVYHRQGVVAAQRGDLQQAEAWYHKALQIDETLGRRGGKAMIYHSLGMVAQARRDMLRAEEWYRKAIDLKQELGNRPALASSYHQLGTLCEERGHLRQAEDWYRKALQINEALRNQPGLAITYHQLGEVAQARRDLPQAELWYRRSLEINEILRNKPRAAANYYGLGRLAQARLELLQAEQWYRKSLQVKTALGDRAGMAISYYQLGRVAYLRRDLRQAEDQFEKSLEITEALGNRPGMATAHKTYRMLGTLAEDRGDHHQAETWYRKSLETAEVLGDRKSMASSYFQLGLVAQRRGDYPLAEDWYWKALEIYEALDSRNGMATTNLQLGVVAQFHGDTQEALERTVRCVALYPDITQGSNAPGPHHLARLTEQLGMPALEDTWRQVTGEALPGQIRKGMEHLQNQA